MTDTCCNNKKKIALTIIAIALAYWLLFPKYDFVNRGGEIYKCNKITGGVEAMTTTYKNPNIFLN